MNRLLIIIFLFVAAGVSAQRYEFDKSLSEQEWQYIGTPDSTKYELCNGCLRLYGSVYDLSEGRDFTFVGQALPDKDFTFETKLTMLDSFDGDEGGICLCRSREAYAACCISNYHGDHHLKLCLQLFSHKLTLYERSIGTLRTLWLRVTQCDGKYVFQYSPDNEKWQTVQSVEKRLLSPIVTGSDSALLAGPYCFTGNSKYNAGYTYADFDYAEYK